MFITFEGGEGVGKSTQVRRLVARLERRGHAALATREPGGSPKAEALRRLLLSGAAVDLGPEVEAILFAAARIDHVAATIRPGLAAGAIVVCDRFIDSTRAYQGALGHVSPALLDVLETVAAASIRPDLTLVLDLPSAVGLARAAGRTTLKPDRFEGETLAFHEALREAFLQLAAREPARCAVIDAGLDPDGVEDAIWAAVEPRLPALTAEPSP